MERDLGIGLPHPLTGVEQRAPSVHHRATGAVDLLQALVDAAPSEDALVHLGAGPVEDLVSHYRYGQAVVAEVERHARQDPRFARAMSAVWLGSDVPLEVRRRLARFGARDLTEGPNPSA